MARIKHKKCSEKKAGNKRDDVAEDWRNLRSEKFNTLHSPDIIRGR
jgi:hypothetical protein